MPDSVLIADEVLAEALELPRPRPAIEEILNRPDPFADIWKFLGRMPDDCES